MKKLISVVLLAAALTLLCACGNVAEIPVATAAPEQTAAEELTGVTESAGDEDFTVFIARFSTETESFSDPAGDGVEILSYSVCTPSVEIIGNESASEAVNASIAELNAAYFRNEEGGGTEMDRETEMLSMAEDNYAYYKSGSAENLSVKFTFSRNAEIVSADGKSFVLKFTNVIEANGTDTEEEYYLFDTATGAMKEAAAEDVVSNVEPCTLDRIPLNESDSSGEILDLLIIDENGEDFLYGPEKNEVAYNVDIASRWFCNRMENNYVQVREKA